MFPFRSAALATLCTAVAACDHTPTDTSPDLTPAGGAPKAATTRWAITRLSNGWGAATAINSRGQIVGYHDVPQGTRAFLWQNGTIRSLGTLGGGYSRAEAINEAGQVVGVSTTASGESHAFLWENGTMRDLGTLGTGSSWATAIESGGRVVGYTSGPEGKRAFIWENGTMKRLAGLTAGYSEARDIDNMGRVVGIRGSTTTPRAFRWVAGKVRDLGTLGGPSSVASAIGPSGRIVGTSTLADGSERAFLWQNGVMSNLGTLAGGMSGAAAISGMSHVVGTSQLIDGQPRVFLWQDGTRTDVAAGIGTGVNRDGWTVGWRSLDKSFPFLWRPTTEPPPAPGKITVGTSFFYSERNGSADQAVDTVAVGAEVTWTWISGPAVKHSVQSVGSTRFTSSGFIGGVGMTYKVKFTKAGSYQYNCAAHPGNMTGRIVVK